MAEDINELCYIKEVKLIYYHNIGTNLTYDDYFEILKKVRLEPLKSDDDTIISKIRYIGR